MALAMVRYDELIYELKLLFGTTAAEFDDVAADWSALRERYPDPRDLDEGVYDATMAFGARMDDFLTSVLAAAGAEKVARFKNVNKTIYQDLVSEWVGLKYA